MHPFELFPINSGVRKGYCVSFILFSLFINNLVSYLNDNRPFLQTGEMELNVLLHADDMVVMAETDLDVSLQVVLNEIYNWCTNWS